MDQLIQAITDILNVYDKKLSDEYYYQSLPLCVLDAVFSIGVRYEGVRNVVKTFCAHAACQRIRKDRNEIPAREEQFSVSDYLMHYGSIDPEVLAQDVFKNRQRTSTRNGILKAEAVGHFMRVLKNSRVEYLQDIERVIVDKRFEEVIKAIPGQSSGISLQYFFMLAGSNNLIKPDRMVMRFLNRVFPDQTFDVRTATKLLQNAAGDLGNRGIAITPRELDHLIWRYESGRRA